jgi:hypothetical protein
LNPIHSMAPITVPFRPAPSPTDLRTTIISPSVWICVNAGGVSETSRFRGAKHPARAPRRRSIASSPQSCSSSRPRTSLLRSKESRLSRTFDKARKKPTFAVSQASLPPWWTNDSTCSDFLRSIRKLLISRALVVVSHSFVSLTMYAVI